MGGKATLSKAIMELEKMYSGIPDESVNLTFQHQANAKQNPNSPQKKKLPATNNNMELPISEDNTNNVEGNTTPLKKIPSLDFRKALQASNHHHHHHRLDRITEDDVVHRFSGHHIHDKELSHRYRHDHQAGQHRNNASPINSVAHSGFRHAVESSMVVADGRSMASVYQERNVGRRRPGIPHLKICTVCSTYIHVFRHRCLVCVF